MRCQITPPLALTANGQDSFGEVKLVNPWTHGRGEYPTMEGAKVLYLASFHCEGPDRIYLGPLGHRTIIQMEIHISKNNQSSLIIPANVQIQ